MLTKAGILIENHHTFSDQCIARTRPHELLGDSLFVFCSGKYVLPFCRTTVVIIP